MKARIQIRQSRYRGDDGWLICGQHPKGGRVSIFVKELQRAKKIQEKVQRGEQLTLEDFRESAKQ